MKIAHWKYLDGNLRFGDSERKEVNSKCFYGTLGALSGCACTDSTRKVGGAKWAASIRNLQTHERSQRWLIE